MQSIPLAGLFWTLAALQVSGVGFALIGRVLERTPAHGFVQALFFVLFLISAGCAICAFWWGPMVGLLHGFALAFFTLTVVFDTRMSAAEEGLEVGR